MVQQRTEQLYDRHADALFGFLLNLTQHEADTRDLLQSLFVKLAQNPDMLAGARDERAYLLQVAHRMFIDLVRRRQAGDRLLEKVAAESAIQDAPALFVIDSNLCAEERQRLEAALSALPHDQRAAVQLRIWEQRTFEEIAAITGVSKATAVSRYRYALDKLRSRLAREFDHSHLPTPKL
ncbi:MAG: sigma-70 family RNA polymerase sigma factor [Verrucomicrobiales bacterium]